MIDPNGVYAWALRWRGIEPGEECPECGGSGWIVYGSTATYMGGIGGAAMTPGACNVCWGSGRRDTIWPSHKAMRLSARATDSPKDSTTGD